MRGAAMIEFVLVFPLVLAIVLGCIQAMVMAFQKSVIDDAIVDVVKTIERSTQICDDIAAPKLNGLDTGDILPNLERLGSVFMTGVRFAHDGTDIAAVPCHDAADDPNNRQKIVFKVNYALRCLVCSPLTAGLMGNTLPFSARHLLRPEGFGSEQSCIYGIDYPECSDIP